LNWYYNRGVNGLENPFMDLPGLLSSRYWRGYKSVLDRGMMDIFDDYSIGNMKVKDGGIEKEFIQRNQNNDIQTFEGNQTNNLNTIQNNTSNNCPQHQENIPLVGFGNSIITEYDIYRICESFLNNILLDNNQNNLEPILTQNSTGGKSVPLLAIDQKKFCNLFFNKMVYILLNIRRILFDYPINLSEKEIIPLPMYNKSNQGKDVLTVENIQKVMNKFNAQYIPSLNLSNNLINGEIQFYGFNVMNATDLGSYDNKTKNKDDTDFRKWFMIERNYEKNNYKKIGNYQFSGLGGNLESNSLPLNISEPDYQNETTTGISEKPLNLDKNRINVRGNMDEKYRSVYYKIFENEKTNNGIHQNYSRDGGFTNNPLNLTPANYNTFSNKLLRGDQGGYYPLSDPDSIKDYPELASYFRPLKLLYTSPTTIIPPEDVNKKLPYEYFDKTRVDWLPESGLPITIAHTKQFINGFRRMMNTAIIIRAFPVRNINYLEYKKPYIFKNIGKQLNVNLYNLEESMINHLIERANEIQPDYKKDDEFMKELNTNWNNNYTNISDIYIWYNLDQFININDPLDYLKRIRMFIDVLELYDDNNFVMSLYDFGNVNKLVLPNVEDLLRIYACDQKENKESIDIYGHILNMMNSKCDLFTHNVMNERSKIIQGLNVGGDILQTGNEYKQFIVDIQKKYSNFIGVLKDLKSKFNVMDEISSKILGNLIKKDVDEDFSSKMGFLIDTLYTNLDDSGSLVRDSENKKQIFGLFERQLMQLLEINFQKDRMMKEYQDFIDSTRKSILSITLTRQDRIRIQQQYNEGLAELDKRMYEIRKEIIKIKYYIMKVFVYCNNFKEKIMTGKISNWETRYERIEKLEVELYTLFFEKMIDSKEKDFFIDFEKQMQSVDEIQLEKLVFAGKDILGENMIQEFIKNDVIKVDNLRNIDTLTQDESYGFWVPVKLYDKESKDYVYGLLDLIKGKYVNNFDKETNDAKSYSSNVSRNKISGYIVIAPSYKKFVGSNQPDQFSTFYFTPMRNFNGFGPYKNIILTKEEKSKYKVKNYKVGGDLSENQIKFGGSLSKINSSNLKKLGGKLNNNNENKNLSSSKKISEKYEEIRKTRKLVLQDVLFPKEDKITKIINGISQTFNVKQFERNKFMIDQWLPNARYQFFKDYAENASKLEIDQSFALMTWGAEKFLNSQLVKFDRYNKFIIDNSKKILDNTEDFYSLYKLFYNTSSRMYLDLAKSLGKNVPKLSQIDQYNYAQYNYPLNGLFNPNIAKKNGDLFKFNKDPVTFSNSVLNTFKYYSYNAELSPNVGSSPKSDFDKSTSKDITDFSPIPGNNNSLIVQNISVNVPRCDDVVQKIGSELNNNKTISILQSGKLLMGLIKPDVFNDLIPGTLSLIIEQLSKNVLINVNNTMLSKHIYNAGAGGAGGANNVSTILDNDADTDFVEKHYLDFIKIPTGGVSLLTNVQNFETVLRGLQVGITQDEISAGTLAFAILGIYLQKLSQIAFTNITDKFTNNYLTNRQFYSALLSKGSTGDENIFVKNIINTLIELNCFVKSSVVEIYSLAISYASIACYNGSFYTPPIRVVSTLQRILKKLVQEIRKNAIISKNLENNENVLEIIMNYINENNGNTDQKLEIVKTDFLEKYQIIPQEELIKNENNDEYQVDDSTLPNNFESDKFFTEDESKYINNFIGEKGGQFDFVSLKENFKYLSNGYNLNRILSSNSMNNILESNLNIADSVNNFFSNSNFNDQATNPLLEKIQTAFQHIFNLPNPNLENIITGKSYVIGNPAVNPPDNKNIAYMYAFNIMEMIITNYTISLTVGMYCSKIDISQNYDNLLKPILEEILKYLLNNPNNEVRGVDEIDLSKMMIKMKECIDGINFTGSPLDLNQQKANFKVRNLIILYTSTLVCKQRNNNFGTLSYVFNQVNNFYNKIKLIYSGNNFNDEKIYTLVSIVYKASKKIYETLYTDCNYNVLRLYRTNNFTNTYYFNSNNNNHDINTQIVNILTQMNAKNDLTNSIKNKKNVISYFCACIIKSFCGNYNDASKDKNSSNLEIPQIILNEIKNTGIKSNLGGGGGNHDYTLINTNNNNINGILRNILNQENPIKNLFDNPINGFTKYYVHTGINNPINKVLDFISKSYENQYCPGLCNPETFAYSISNFVAYRNVLNISIILSTLFANQDIDNVDINPVNGLVNAILINGGVNLNQDLLLNTFTLDDYKTTAITQQFLTNIENAITIPNAPPLDPAQNQKLTKIAVATATLAGSGSMTLKQIYDKIKNNVNLGDLNPIEKEVFYKSLIGFYTLKNLFLSPPKDTFGQFLGGANALLVARNNVLNTRTLYEAIDYWKDGNLNDFFIDISQSISRTALGDYTSDPTGARVPIIVNKNIKPPSYGANTAIFSILDGLTMIPAQINLFSSDHKLNNMILESAIRGIESSKTQPCDFTTNAPSQKGILKILEILNTYKQISDSEKGVYLGVIDRLAFADPEYLSIGALPIDKKITDSVSFNVFHGERILNEVKHYIQRMTEKIVNGYIDVGSNVNAVSSSGAIIGTLTYQLNSSINFTELSNEAITSPPVIAPAAGPNLLDTPCLSTDVILGGTKAVSTRFSEFNDPNLEKLFVTDTNGGAGRAINFGSINAPASNHQVSTGIYKELNNILAHGYHSAETIEHTAPSTLGTDRVIEPTPADFYKSLCQKAVGSASSAMAMKATIASYATFWNATQVAAGAIKRGFLDTILNGGPNPAGGPVIAANAGATWGLRLGTGGGGGAVADPQRASEEVGAIMGAVATLTSQGLTFEEPIYNNSMAFQIFKNSDLNYTVNVQNSEKNYDLVSACGAVLQFIKGKKPGNILGGYDDPNDILTLARVVVNASTTFTENNSAPGRNGNNYTLNPDEGSYLRASEIALAIVCELTAGDLSHIGGGQRLTNNQLTNLNVSAILINDIASECIKKIKESYEAWIGAKFVQKQTLENYEQIIAIAFIAVISSFNAKTAYEKNLTDDHKQFSASTIAGITSVFPDMGYESGGGANPRFSISLFYKYIAYGTQINFIDEINHITEIDNSININSQATQAKVVTRVADQAAGRGLSAFVGGEETNGLLVCAKATSVCAILKVYDAINGKINSDYNCLTVAQDLFKETHPDQDCYLRKALTVSCLSALVSGRFIQPFNNINNYPNLPRETGLSFATKGANLYSIEECKLLGKNAVSSYLAGIHISENDKDMSKKIVEKILTGGAPADFNAKKEVLQKDFMILEPYSDIIASGAQNNITSWDGVGIPKNEKIQTLLKTLNEEESILYPVKNQFGFRLPYTSIQLCELLSKSVEKMACATAVSVVKEGNPFPQNYTNMDKVYFGSSFDNSFSANTFGKMAIVHMSQDVSLDKIHKTGLYNTDSVVETTLLAKGTDIKSVCKNIFRYYKNGQLFQNYFKIGDSNNIYDNFKNYIVIQANNLLYIINLVIILKDYIYNNNDNFKDFNIVYFLEQAKKFIENAKNNLSEPIDLTEGNENSINPQTNSLTVPGTGINYILLSGPDNYNTITNLNVGGGGGSDVLFTNRKVRIEKNIQNARILLSELIKIWEEKIINNKDIFLKTFTNFNELFKKGDSRFKQIYKNYEEYINSLEKKFNKKFEIYKKDLEYLQKLEKEYPKDKFTIETTNKIQDFSKSQYPLNDDGENVVKDMYNSMLEKQPYVEDSIEHFIKTQRDNQISVIKGINLITLDTFYNMVHKNLKDSNETNQIKINNTLKGVSEDFIDILNIADTNFLRTFKTNFEKTAINEDFIDELKKVSSKKIMVKSKKGGLKENKLNKEIVIYKQNKKIMKKKKSMNLYEIRLRRIEKLVKSIRKKLEK